MDSEYFIILQSFSKTSAFAEAIVIAKTEKAPAVDSMSLMMAQQCNCSHSVVGVGDQVILLNVKHRHSRCPPFRLDVDVADIQPHPVKNKFGRVLFDVVTGLFD